MPLAAGQSNLYFARDTRVFIEQGTNIWEVPVLDGYSFSQSTNTSEIALAEMAGAGGASRRGRRVFTDSFAPSEWSFDSYARPYLVTGTPNRMRAVEEVLWANFVANNSYTAGTFSWTSGVTISPTALDFAFGSSNVILLGTFNIYYVLGASSTGGLNFLSDADTTIYKVNSAVINEATMNFDIDGIAMISWSGMGGKLEEVASFNATAALVGGIANTNNFIRNRLTQLTATSSVSGGSKTYDLTLTGGSITINNNISFLTPESIGRVNQPIGHVVGGRTVSGNFTTYLDEKTNGSIDLFDDISKAVTAVTNSFALDFYVGGKAAGDATVSPGVQFKMPNAHLSLPSFDNSDVISVDVAFDALPSTISGTDEITKVSYIGPV